MNEKKPLALKINRPHEISIRDRRRGSDRRKSPRYAVNIDIFWETLAGTDRGTISDISSYGCFVLCSGEVEDGESVKIYIPLMSGETIELWGEVVNHVFELGYGVRFTELGLREQLFVERLVNKLSQRVFANPRRR